MTTETVPNKPDNAPGCFLIIGVVFLLVALYSRYMWDSWFIRNQAGIPNIEERLERIEKKLDILMKEKK